LPRRSACGASAARLSSLRARAVVAQRHIAARRYLFIRDMRRSAGARRGVEREYVCCAFRHCHTLIHYADTAFHCQPIAITTAEITLQRRRLAVLMMPAILFDDTMLR